MILKNQSTKTVKRNSKCLDVLESHRLVEDDIGWTVNSPRSYKLKEQSLLGDVGIDRYIEQGMLVP